ncbi:cationic amino acid transporter [Zygosaccharomyces mellis]|uniref:Cationic amino acid transporter n=1 Tax=Zygosaccharomyces mellis TaxID=42258 RepID=A0A4C2DZJ9_9SACH|nr:cationic amino acid transporter [Zygosaccharomyces mellis]
MKLMPIEWNSENISGIAGSISIACWVIVFVPQIYENFHRKSAEGLSLMFVVLWLAGDVFNLVGAILQHLLPTMIILAAYYTLADIILLIQCIWYGTEEKVDPVHLSPANPMSESVLQDVFHEGEPLLYEEVIHHSNEPNEEYQTLDNNVEIVTENGSKRYFKDALIVTAVVFGGFLSWYISYCNDSHNSKPSEPDLTMNWLAQLFGYLSAILYLGSRIPQILLNFQRKSCEGISFLFFLFACLGNGAFILSVVIISLDSKYLLVNASWLIGSLGTLFMDFVIFIQFFAYGKGRLVSSNDFA